MAETKRVIYYDQLSGNTPTNGDVIFVDNPNTGTHKMDLKSFVDAINNGFDSSIKSSGVSVSADNYSSIITNVNDQPVNSIYTYGAGLQSHVSNLPSNKAMTIVNLAQKSTGGLGQVMLAIERNGSGDYLYFRTIGGSPATWSSWVKVANSADVEAVREALDNLDIETDKTLSVDGKPADAKAAGDAINDLKADLSGIVSVHENFLEDATALHDGYWKRSTPIDWSSVPKYNAFAPIDVIGGVTYYYKHVFLYYTVIVYDGSATVTTLTDNTTQDMSGSFTPSANGKLYITSNKQFTPIFTDDEELYNSPTGETYYTPNKLKITQLSDTDDLINEYGYIDGYYINGSGTPSSNADFRITEHIQVEADSIFCLKWKGQMFVATYQADKTFISRQIFNSGLVLANSKIHIPSSAKYIRLSYVITTQEYTKFAKEIQGAEFHVGANYPYTKFSDALNDAVKTIDNVVRIHSGTYDLYEELGGSSYFDSYTYSSDGEGLAIKNRVHITGSSDSKIIFNYPGANAQVKQYFSPLNAHEEGFVLENVNIECANCRYAVHDERYTDDDLYVNKYLNCNFSIDNSENSYGYRQCIGGGLGTNGEIIIKDCYFKTVGANVGECVSYHNSSSNSAKSRIIVSGNYCDNGTMRFSWHGTSTKITEVIAINNSIPSAIITRAEQASDTAENVTLKAWNNVIRN